MVHPALGITTGDPAGVGPEVSLRACLDASLSGQCDLLLFGDARLLACRARDLGLDADFEILSPEELATSSALPGRAIVDVPATGAVIRPGEGCAAGGDAAARAVIECARACLAGRIQAMVTAPISKIFLQEAGYPFPGHTEFLAHLAGVRDVAMAFLSERLKVVLVTVHMPLRAAIERITPEAILRTLGITLAEFPRLGLACSRLAVAGMNPHAGESGLLGTEEREIIAPALAEARRLHPAVTIDGPLPADTVFHRAAQGEYDAVVALFHDQGLAPLKMIGFGESVNVTLGLPFVRTSVDHGTAYEIAGKGIARAEGMITAIRWALRLLRRSRSGSKAESPAG